MCVCVCVCVCIYIYIYIYIYNKNKVTELAQRKLASTTIVQQKLAGEHMLPQCRHRYMTKFNVIINQRKCAAEEGDRCKCSNR